MAEQSGVLARDGGAAVVGARIAARREAVDAYLRTARVRQRRLLVVGVVAGAVASALTAGPAIGGGAFSDRVTEGLGLSTPAWQLLCLAASVCSLTAALATQLLRSQRLEERIAQAQLARTKLELVDLGLAVGRVSSDQAVTELATCAELTSFL
jgi:MFS family permease